MPNRDNLTLGARLLPLAAALLLASAVPAAAQEPTPMQRFLGTLGLLEIPDDPIDYRERAPLVVPPSSALIPPRSPDDIAKFNPDWPLDHDSQKRRAVDEEYQKQVDEQFYSGRPLTPAEINRGRISRAEAARREGARQPASTTIDPEIGVGRLSPTQLGFKGWGAKKNEAVVFTGEPERRSLTEPPPGLRTPSPNAPYGVVTSDRGPVKPPSIFDRGNVD